MKMWRARVKAILILCGMFLSVCHAQISESVYKTDVHIAPEKEGSLLFELDNVSFFRNNEYKGSMAKGYTLPGLWIQPKLVYYPLKNIKLEAGAHMLHYWGANRYPNLVYQDIAKWEGEQFQNGFHAVPFFRAQASLFGCIDIVFGNLYGGANHNLIEPLYSSELNLSADPEAGLQLLYSSAYVDLDMWVNWTNFIFRNDVHQESFIFGFSSKVKFNSPKSRFHLYAPVQILAQHRGGEIDTIYTNSVQTLANASVGVGCQWNTGNPVFKRVNFEVDAVGYSQLAGKMWPFEKGGGLYAKASADIRDFRIKADYFQNHQFLSLLGLPFYGAMSMIDENLVYRNPGLGHIGVEYAHRFAKGFALGVEVDFYQSLSGKAVSSDLSVQKEKAASGCVSAGVSIRINPSFLIKRFHAQ